MNYLDEFQGLVVLPSALFSEFEKLFMSAEDFVVWLFLLHNGDSVPSEISEKINKDLPEVNAAIDRLQKSGLLRIDGSGGLIFDVSPTFEKLSEMTEVKTPTDQSDTTILQGLTDAFQAEMGVISPMQVEEIRHWLDQDHYDPQLIREALKEASLNRKVNLNYIRAILRNWQNAGVLTVADVADKRLEREAARAPEAEESFFIPTEGPWNAK